MCIASAQRPCAAFCRSLQERHISRKASIIFFLPPSSCSAEKASAASAGVCAEPLPFCAGQPAAYARPSCQCGNLPGGGTVGYVPRGWPDSACAEWLCIWQEPAAVCGFLLCQMAGALVLACLCGGGFCLAGLLLCAFRLEPTMQIWFFALSCLWMCDFGNASCFPKMHKTVCRTRNLCRSN